MIDKNIWQNSKPLQSAKPEIQKTIAKYFLFRNIELKDENSFSILDAVYNLGVKFPSLRVYDLYLALKHFGSNEEKNISPSYVLDCITKYLKSDVRKAFQKTIDLDSEKRMLPPASIDEDLILKMAEENLRLLENRFNKYGQISVGMSEKQFSSLVSAGYFTTGEEMEEEAFQWHYNQIKRQAENSLDKIMKKQLNNICENIISGNLSGFEKATIIKRFVLKNYFESKKNIQ